MTTEQSSSSSPEEDNSGTVETANPASSSETDVKMKTNSKSKSTRAIRSNAAVSAEAAAQDRSNHQRTDTNQTNSSQNRNTRPSNDNNNNSRSIQSSIVIRQTEETLQTLQRNLHYASHELLQSLGTYLSKLPTATTTATQNSKSAGGISLPASAVGWLASELQTLTTATTTTTATRTQQALLLSQVQELLPRLTHLRITAKPWPPAAPATAPPRSWNSTSPSNIASSSIQRQHQTLQYLHRLRYSPRVNVGIFSNCQVLLLDQVPPEWVMGLPSLADSLQVLRVERACLYDLELFLLGNNNIGSATTKSNDNHDDGVIYSKLTHVKLAHCSLGEMTRGLAPLLGEDGRPEGIVNDNNSNTKKSNRHIENKLPLARMPQLVSLSLAHNDIHSETTALGCGISNASKLSVLDLSYNNLPSLVNAHLYLGNIKTLLLTGNRIESADGLGKLYALHTLALDENRIEEWVDVACLARLPELQSLKLKGNPLMESSMDRKYARVMLLDLFREQRWGSLGENATFRQLGMALPVLDGKPAETRELKALQQRAFPNVPAIILPRNYNSNDDNDITTLPIGTTAGMTIKKLPKRRNGALKRDDIYEEEGAVVVTPSSASCGTHKGKRRRRRKVAKAIIIDDGTALDSQKDAAQVLLTLKKEVKASLQPHSADESENEELACEGEKGEAQGETHPQEPSQSLASPKISFSIQEVLSSLTPSSEGETAAKSSSGKDHTNAHSSEHNSNSSTDPLDAVETKTDESSNLVSGFEWPEPLAYVPEHNLYDEFELKPRPKKPLKKNKRRKQKPSKAKKPGEKVPLQQSIAKSAAVTGSSNVNGLGSATHNGRKSSRAPRPAESETPTTPRTKGNSSTPASAASSSQNSSTIRGEGTTNDIHGDAVEEASLSASDASAVSLRTGNRSSSYELRSVSSDGSAIADFASPRDSVAGAFFPAMAMAANGDDNTSSSIETNRSSIVSGQRSKTNARSDKFLLAEMKSKFLGLEHQRQLTIVDNLELYFKTFVFPDLLPGINASQDSTESDSWRSIFFRFPRIQLLPNDRELREAYRTKGASVQRHRAVGEEEREQFVRVWRENVLALGKPSLKRLPPNRTAHYGFHGELTWVDGKVKTVSDCRQVILCLSNTSFYVILDNDTASAKEKATTTINGNGSQGISPDSAASKRSGRKRSRKFPSPIEAGATFEQALWPHAVACHPVEDLQSITIGFGFQRMALRFRNTAYPSAVDFTYLLLTSNKMQTVALLQEMQGLVKEVKLETTLKEDPIKIDNDDKVFLDALASAVAPDPIGAVLHYQIVKQRWKHGQRGAVSRACVVTDSKIFLLDEDYIGDGSKSVEADSSRRLGSPSFCLVDGADLQQVAEVQAADADPNAITIVIRPSSSLLRTHRWRLLCRDRTGAEKLVETVRRLLE